MLRLQANNIYKFYQSNNYMPKQETSSDAMISETGNWNVADQYTKSKIMRPLNMCDVYEDLATYGYESIIDELVNFQAPPNDLIRIQGLRRLIKELIRLIDNVKFALRIGKTKETALKYRQSLKKLEKGLPGLIKKTHNEIDGTSSISIVNYNIFDNVLSMVSEIKSKINEPLNKNHLIFTDKEEFDPKAYKDNLKRRMVNKG